MVGCITGTAKVLISHGTEIGATNSSLPLIPISVAGEIWIDPKLTGSSTSVVALKIDGAILATQVAAKLEARSKFLEYMTKPGIH